MHFMDCEMGKEGEACGCWRRLANKLPAAAPAPRLPGMTPARKPFAPFTRFHFDSFVFGRTAARWFARTLRTAGQS